VQQRIDAARLLDEAVSGCSWLIPQHVPEHCGHAYWAYVVKLHHPHIGWRQFREAFVRAGGDGIYSAWKLTYQEPMFVRMELLRRQSWISPERAGQYRTGLCPVAESLQPKLLQFKTNYWDIREAEQQALILKQTIAALESRS